MKTRVDQLAIDGGKPAFSQPLHVGRPNIGDQEAFLRRVDDILERRWLTNHGIYVRELERRIEAITTARHAITVCNATIGLEVTAQALELYGEVIVPSFTFIASVHALRRMGLTPVFCDIDPQTHTLDPRHVQRCITGRTSAILGVHTWGRGCDDAALSRIAGEHGLKLFYDAAHAFACSHRGRMIGGLGAAEVFSFHATKFINTFEGGAIVTNDDDLAERLRAAINFGYDEHDEIRWLGTNGKMSEISAAMGITGIESMEGVIARNYENYSAYRGALSGLPGFHVLAYPEGERNNFQYVVVEIDAGKAGIDRDTLVDVLRAENVLARKYFYPGCHMAEPYRSEQPQAGLHLPCTNTLVQRVMTLPNGTAVTPKDVGIIARLIELARQRAEAGSARMITWTAESKIR